MPVNKASLSFTLVHTRGPHILYKDVFSHTDLLTPTFFAYFLRFWAPKYAQGITITELRTQESPDF